MATTQKVFAYIRAGADRQDIEGQRLEILAWADSRDMRIDGFIEADVPSRKSLLKRRISELLGRVNEGDTVIVAELSRIGRSIVEVVNIVNELAKKKVRLVAVRQGLDIGDDGDEKTRVVTAMFSMLAGIEQDFISQRKKSVEAALKAGGRGRGKPKGTIGSSKLDPYREFIENERKFDAPVTLIARKLKAMTGNCTRQNLVKYMKSRGIK